MNHSLFLVLAFAISHSALAETVHLAPKAIQVTTTEGETKIIQFDRILLRRFENSAKDHSRIYADCKKRPVQHPAYAPFDSQGNVSVPTMQGFGDSWRLNDEIAYVYSKPYTF